jgi:hypothetical protein
MEGNKFAINIVRASLSRGENKISFLVGQLAEIIQELLAQGF